MPSLLGAQSYRELSSATALNICHPEKVPLNALSIGLKKAGVWKGFWLKNPIKLHPLMPHNAPHDVMPCQTRVAEGSMLDFFFCVQTYPPRLHSTCTTPPPCLHHTSITRPSCVHSHGCQHRHRSHTWSGTSCRSSPPTLRCHSVVTMAYSTAPSLFCGRWHAPCHQHLSSGQGQGQGQA